MIRIKNASLRYPLIGQRSHSLQVAIYGKVGGLISSRRSGDSKPAYVSALTNINLEIGDAQRVGIIGHNGAGKTTLLRLISGVYPPSEGTVETSGRISALTDVALGMDMNASGMKNIVFRLVFMGHNFKEAEEASHAIAAYSELGEFINLPMHTYSAGMFLRLAFAVSTHFSPDILLLDEIVGAGDESFKAKANSRIERLLDESRIVILSSHDLGSIKRYCSRAILMKHGSVVFDGDTNSALEAYKAIYSAS